MDGQNQRTHLSREQKLSDQAADHLVESSGVEGLRKNIKIQMSRLASVDRVKEQKNRGVPTWPGCWPGMAARTFMVVPRGPKAEGGMLGWKEGLVKTTLAWGWGPL